MKKLIFAVFGLVTIVTACRKNDYNSCTSLGHEQNWTKYEGNPVFTKGEKSWDDGIVIGHSVIKDGNTFRMWYSGGHNIQDPKSIGYATSTDGIHWTRYSGNPVFEGIAGSWDQGNVVLPTVLQDRNTLRMWYLGGLDGDAGTIGYAVSEDGIHWNRHSSPVFQARAGTWYEDGIFPGTVIKENGVFKMWFSGAFGGSLSGGSPTTESAVGYATSTDGITWTFYDDPATTSAPYQSSDPVLQHGKPGEWDAAAAIEPSVIRTKCGYEMWYIGGVQEEGTHQKLGYAFSSDGIHWTKYSKNPVLLPDKWNTDLVFPSVILEGNKYRMWYGAFLLNGDALGGAIGYATMPG
jgi:sucrose-6-phosphate hydrolase SacC (GH32 family)